MPRAFSLEFQAFGRVCVPFLRKVVVMETAWLLIAIGAFLIVATVAAVLLYRRLYRLTYVPVEPPFVPARERDPALVAIARELDAQGLAAPDVPRAITARTRAASHHARAPPWPALGGGNGNDRPN